MDKKQIFLEQAWQQFNQSGFHASGIEQMSEKLGITKKTLYRYFQSKDQLIIEVLEYRHARFMASVLAAVQHQYQQDAALAYLNFIEHWVQQDDFFGCTFINASAEYAKINTLPHQIAHQHKQELLGLLSAQGIAEPMLTQLFILAEGLIVSSQVMGYQAAQFLNIKRLVPILFKP